MKSIVIVANWKSNKTVAEADSWLGSFKSQVPDGTIILAAPFTLLHLLHERKSGFELGAQDVSPLGVGAYTGAINAQQLKELVDWVIVGHSERRKNFGETDDILKQKVFQAKNAGLRVIFCVSDETETVPEDADIVAYEPIGAIGSGQSEDPRASNEIIARLKEKTKVPIGLYGGSVTPDNVASFIQQPAIDGVLVGGVSLDPTKFLQLIHNASNA